MTVAEARWVKENFETCGSLQNEVEIYQGCKTEKTVPARKYLTFSK